VTGRNKPLDDLSNLMTNAVGAFIQDMDLVSREEFDVLKARLDAALAEIEMLKGGKKPVRKTATKKAPAKKTTRKPAAKKKA